MKEEKVWEVLGVEPGADEEIIKTAYREKLVGTNPEDDPEGFKLLREAYEMAINLRNRKSEEPVVDEKEKTPAEKLVEQAAELYFDIFRRNDPKCWEDFFSDPLIEGLDTIDEVRRAFLVFTMNHFVYSPEMWKEFDRVFRLVDEEKSLAEEFPPDFINYIKERIIDGEYFTYDDITDSGDEMAVFVRSLPISAEGSYEEEGLDCKEDIYIRNVTSLLPLYSTVDNKYSADEDKERLKVEIAERINAARRYSIFHPFEGLGLMMYYYITGDRENALKVAEYSTASDRIDSCDKFSVSYSAHVVMDRALKENDQDTDHLDMIAERLKKIVSDNPKFQMAHFALAEYYYFKGDHVKASDHILNASEYNEASVEIDAFIDKNDIGLVKYYRDRIDSGIATENDHIELGWCLLRNEDYANSDITKLLDEISPTPETEYNYYNLYARCCVKDEDYKKAFPYVKRWHEMVLETYERSLREGTENFSPEEKKRLARVSYSYYLMAICNAEAGNFDEAEKDYRKASEFAENKNDKIIFLKVLGEYYHKEKKYNYAFDLWNEILDMEPRFTPGYMMRQEAAYKTGRARQVVDDFFEIISFAPEYKMAYVYAARIFNSYDQTEDLLKVMDKAEENGAVSPMLLFEKARAFRKENRYEEAVEIFKGLDENLEYASAEEIEEKQETSEKEEEEGAIDNKAAFYAEYGYCMFEFARATYKKSDQVYDTVEEGQVNYRALGNEIRGKAWTCVEKGLAADEKNLQIHWLITDLLENQGEDASEEYEKMKKIFPEESSVDFEYGCYLERMNKRDEAAEQFLSATKKDPNHQDAYGKLTDYYIDRYENTEKALDYDKAINFIERQIENCDDSYFRIKQALAYIEGYEFEKALEAADIAVKQSPDNIFAYNARGYALMMMDRLTEAEEAFRTGLTYMQTPRKTALQYNLVICLERQMKFKEAYEFYLEYCKSLKIVGKECTERKAKLLKRMGNYKEAEELYGKLYSECAREFINSDGVHMQDPPRFMLYKLTSSYNGAVDNRDDMADLQLTMMDLYVLSGDKRRYNILNKDIRKYADMELGAYGIEKLLKRDMNDKAFKAEMDDRMSAIQMIGMHMLYVGRDYVLAEKCFDIVSKIVELFKDDEEKRYSDEWSALVYMRYAESCFRNGNKEKAASAARKGMKYYLTDEKSLDEYLAYHNYRPRRLSQIAKLYYYMGDRDKAYTLIDAMSRCGFCSESNGERKGLCSDCHERKCYEVYLVLAKFAELEDNYILALEYYKKAHEITDDDSEVEIAIKILS